MEENEQLTLVTQEVSSVTKNISSIKGEITDAITDNNKSLRACISAGEGLLDKSEEGMNDELDAEISQFIKKGKATIKSMSERRKKVTQVFDLVKHGFTAMEGFLNPKDEESIIFKLQKKRDEYAAYKLEQQRKAEQERQKQARITAQKEQIASDMRTLCSDILTVVSQEKVSDLNKLFSDITLENSQKNKAAILNFGADLKISSLMKHSTVDPCNRTALEIIVDNFLDSKYSDLSPEEIKNARNSAYLEAHVVDYEEKFYNTISETRTELLDKFDSKITELKEAKRLEDERKKADEEARKAKEEAEKKAAEAKRIADEEARKKADEEACKAREEADKKAAEAKKAEEERKKKEEELRKADEESANKKKKELEEEADKRQQQEKIEQSKGQANSLFNEAPTLSSPVKAKVTRHIEISSKEAFLDVIQMWWTYEGSKMSLDDLNKKLGFMVKTCEKQANKEDNLIRNDAIRYVEDIVAK